MRLALLPAALLAIAAMTMTTAQASPADDMILVTGRGRVSTRDDLIKAAREKQIVYEKQVEIDGTQKVRVWGDAAVVTALLWLKYSKDGKDFDYKLWFSDTYVRTPKDWRYAFGQASIPLPKE